MKEHLNLTIELRRNGSDNGVRTSHICCKFMLESKRGKKQILISRGLQTEIVFNLHRNGKITVPFYVLKINFQLNTLITDQVD